MKSSNQSSMDGASRQVVTDWSVCDEKSPSLRQEGRVPAQYGHALPMDATAFAKRGGFVEFCAWLRRNMDSGMGENPDFPLRGNIRLRSHISLSFSHSEIHAFDPAERGGVLWLNILTLAGINGVLPLKLSEEIMALRKQGGNSLHEFLDLINLRVWEIFFQSHRIGSRPQYGFNNVAARRLIGDLAKSYVGVDRLPRVEDTVPSGEFNVRLLRHCFSTGRGPGREGSLAELLSHAVSRPVRVTQGLACKIPVPHRCQSRLGLSSALPVLGRFSILGQRAVARQLMSIELPLLFAELNRFLPMAAGLTLRAMVSSLHTVLAGRIFLAAARYRVLVAEIEAGWLGRPTFRLGWGAALGNAGAHTQFIEVSSAAIMSIEGETCSH